MAEERVQRRLAAIMAADVVGYSRMMGLDETATLSRLKALRRDLFEPKTRQYGGRTFKTTGDGAFVEFNSAVEAVKSAADIQNALAARNAEVSEDQKILLRIGISLGDVIVEGSDLYGNGVNVASRMEGLAEPGGICVSGNVHEHIGTSLDLTFEDLGEQSVKNIDRPVRCYLVQLTPNRSTEATSSNPSNNAFSSSRPAIAVLPFDNLSGDPEQEYFSDGITEDIITTLSRIRQFFVIARNTTFTYKGRAVDVQAVAGELGVRYVLEGSVRKAANRVRITAQLIDGETGNHIWADRYDRELADIFAVQDEITDTVVTAIEPELSRAEQDRARRKRPDDLDAWDCYQRGLWHVWRPGRSHNKEAQKFFVKATELDPQFSAAHAGLSIAYLRTVTLGLARDQGVAIQESVNAAHKALAIDDQEAVAYAALSYAGCARGDFQAGIEAAERAIDINPSYAFARLSRGSNLVRVGRAEDAIAELDEFDRLSPRDPAKWIIYDCRAIAEMEIGDFDTALSWTRKAVQHPNAHAVPYIHHVVVLNKLGQTEETRMAGVELMRLMPGFSLKKAPNHMGVVNRHLDLYLDGLRAAGIPEE